VATKRFFKVFFLIQILLELKKGKEKKGEKQQHINHLALFPSTKNRG
jgi:hypothetical protein